MRKKSDSRFPGNLKPEHELKQQYWQQNSYGGGLLSIQLIVNKFPLETVTNWGSRRNSGLNSSKIVVEKKPWSIETALAETIFRMRWWNLLIPKNSKINIQFCTSIKKNQQSEEMFKHFKWNSSKVCFFKKKNAVDFFTLGVSIWLEFVAPFFLSRLADLCLVSDNFRGRLE